MLLEAYRILPGRKDLKAAQKAFLVTFLGASVLLAGFILIYLTYGSTDMSVLEGKEVTVLMALLVLAGIISKSAQLPLQTWLPDAGVAPTPVTALLHAAVLVKIGVYVFARLFSGVLVAPQVFYDWVIVLSGATILVAAGCALVESNIKRILAYSTISQLGYIMLALALRTEVAFAVALMYIAAHSIAKAGLFLCAGIIEHKTGTKNIYELGGLLKVMPLTSAAYLLCAFSIIGIPPFFGFWPKFMTILLCAQNRHIVAAVFCAVGALFTLLYLMRFFSRVFLGERVCKVESFEEKSSVMVRVVLVLGVLSLFLGVFFRPSFQGVWQLIK